MQVWLEPISGLFNTSHPMCAVLTRIGDAVGKANISCEPIYQLAQLAARLFPGNLQAYAGNLDSHAYAAEVIRTERDRVDFPRHLRHELDHINSLLGQGDIEWSLPILDPELYLTEVNNFVSQLVKQNWVTIYLVTDVDLFDHMFPRNNNVIRLTEAAFQAMQVTVGIPKSFHKTAPTFSFQQPALPQQTPKFPLDFFNDEDEDEQEEKPAEKKKVPQHRSIYDESTPSW